MVAGKRWDISSDTHTNTHEYIHMKRRRRRSRRRRTDRHLKNLENCSPNQQTIGIYSLSLAFHPLLCNLLHLFAFYSSF